MNAPEEKYVTDDQTGRRYKLVPEDSTALVFASISGGYLLLMLLFFLWELLDVWSGKLALASRWMPEGLGSTSPTLKVFAYAMIGGGLGGILDEVRSFLKWHAELNAFGKRFIWKSVLAPWQGVVLGLFAVAMFKAGIVVLGGEFSADKAAGQQSVAMFALGALAGYGSRNVMKWLDYQVTRFFATPANFIKTPNLMGRTEAQSQELLKSAGLGVGKLDRRTPTGTIVVAQCPPADADIQRDGTVDITLGDPAPAAPPPPAPPAPPPAPPAPPAPPPAPPAPPVPPAA